MSIPTPRTRFQAFRAKAGELYRQRAVTMFIALAVASAACIVMLAGRVVAFDSRAYLFMVWNLFLAWIPFLISFFLYRLRPRGRVALAVAGCAWLAFLPNAPYMVTDLVHLQTTKSAPIWYDSVMLATFAWTGLFLALVSLRMMQSLVRRRFGNLVSWAFSLVVLGLCGFGVYLGRVQRWNSWDIVANPSKILGSILNVALDPFAHPKALVMTLLMGTFLVIVYMMTSMLLPLHVERGEHDF
jgi:uncharacterized membrane protein